MWLGERWIEFNRPFCGTTDLGRGFIMGNYRAIEQKDVDFC